MPAATNAAITSPARGASALRTSSADDNLIRRRGRPSGGLLVVDDSYEPAVLPDVVIQQRGRLHFSRKNSKSRFERLSRAAHGSILTATTPVPPVT